MRRWLVLALIVAPISFGCSGSGSTPVTPTPAAVPAPPAVPVCQAQNTATVFFENRSTSNLTYDIIWDGSRLGSLGPGQDSGVGTFAANVTHSLIFLVTNTNLTACNTSFPTLTTCSNNFYSCTR